MTSVANILEQGKFGEGPFSEADLTALCSLIDECPWRRLVLPNDHPVYGRIRATLQSKSTESAGWQSLMQKALELFSLLSLAPENIESCTQVLNDVATELDGFVALHLRPTGHSNDDEILSALLTLLLNVSEKTFSGVDAVEMVNGRISAAVAAFTAVFRRFHMRVPVASMMDIPNWQEDASFFVCACRAFYEIGLSQTFFLRLESATDRKMSDLDEEFSSYVTSFNKATLQVPVFDYVGATLCAWFESIERAENVQVLQLLPFFQLALKHTLQLICNMLTTTTHFSGQIKNHLAKNTRIIQSVALPYILFALDFLERGQFDPATVRDQHIVPLALVLRVVSLVSYKIKMFRPWLRSFPLLGARLAKNKVILESDLAVEFFALVIRLVVNAELTDSVPSILETYETNFDQAKKSLIAVRLTSKKERLYPIQVFAPVYVLLRRIFEAPKLVSEQGASSLTFNFNFGQAGSGNTAPAGNARSAGGKPAPVRPLKNAAVSTRRRRQNKNLRFRTRYQKIRAAIGNPLAPCDEVADLSPGYKQENDSENDLSPDDSGVAVAQGKITFEAAETVMNQRGSGVIGDEYVAGGAGKGKPTAVLAEKGQTQRWFGLDSFSGTENDQGSSSDVESPIAMKKNPGGESERSISPASGTQELSLPAPTATRTIQVRPALNPDMIGPGGVDLSAWRKPPPSGVPKQYLCSLSRQFIQIPVISPNGDLFDKDTIVSYLKAQGKVCPITGTTMYPSDLVVDHQLQKELDAVRGNYAYSG